MWEVRGGSGASLPSSGHAGGPLPGSRKAGGAGVGGLGPRGRRPRQARQGRHRLSGAGRPPAPCCVACVCGVRGLSSLCVCVRRPPVPLLCSGAVGGHAVADGARPAHAGPRALRGRRRRCPRVPLAPPPAPRLWFCRDRGCGTAAPRLDSNLLLLPLSLLFPRLAPSVSAPPSSLTGANSGQTDHRSGHNVHRGLRHHHGAGGTR